MLESDLGVEIGKDGITLHVDSEVKVPFASVPGQPGLRTSLPEGELEIELDRRR